MKCGQTNDERNRRGCWIGWLAAGIGLVGLAVLAGCQQAASPSGPTGSTEQPTSSAALGAASSDAGGPEHRSGRPRLVDLGAGKCLPCKKMAPILEELKREYAGVFDVEFIDVWENQRPALHYGIERIPTQIFLDASGKELFRHEGFFSKEEILNQWKTLGVEVDKKGS